MKNYTGYEIKIVREGKEAGFEIYSDGLRWNKIRIETEQLMKIL